MTPIYKGAYTALTTPFLDNGRRIDYEGIRSLSRFQVENGISGIVSVGTTGESATLTWEEHTKVFEETFDEVGSKTGIIASTGSNNTAECIDGTSHAREIGIKHVLLVDPYYNGPSSLEIRREYLEPVATSFPDIGVIPYLIPGRCGTQLLPHDLALASHHCKNIRGVKEATGNLESMRLIRKLCPPDFSILSGDDDKTFAMMTDAGIKAAGVISVVSNVAPKSVQQMCEYASQGKNDEAKRVAEALQPLFEIVTVTTVEETRYGQATCKSRNPVPIKTLMGALGVPSGSLRQPLGRMTMKGLQRLIEQATKVNSEHPEIFEPLQEFFDVNVGERLQNKAYWKGWYYDQY